MVPSNRRSNAETSGAESSGGVHDAADAVEHSAVILNPESGDGNHVEETRDLAAEYGYSVYETESAGETLDLTRDAIADGATVVAACGGDGTVNEVVRGIDAEDAFDEVTFGVIPGGTGNNFALNLGIESIAEGFEVLENGEKRSIDIGVAEENLFVNSCVGGLTAESSSATSDDLKARFGTLAYVLTTLQELSDFDGFDVELGSPDGEEVLWSGSAVCVLIGNARRVGEERSVQANMEDGLLDVTIIEEMPPTELLQTAAVYRLLGEDRDSITRLQTPSIEVVVEDEAEDTLAFSFDGEIHHVERLSASVRSGVLSLRVGDGYEPDPGDD